MFKKLKQIRCDKGVTATKMADILGLDTPAAYYKKESGTIRFSLYDAKKISDYFGLSIEDIFFVNEVSKIETDACLQRES